jgi:hypothetical protein
MNSIIEDSTNNHISLLKVILFILGKDIDLNKDYKILELNGIFINIPDNDLIVNIYNHNKININEFDDEDDDDDEDNDINDKDDDDDEEEEEVK